MIICPNCGENNSDGTKFCPKCGTRLAVPETVKPAAEPEAVSAEPSAVKEELHEETPLGTIYTASSADQPEKKKKNLIPVIAIAAAALLIVILGIIFIPKLFAGSSSTITRTDYVNALNTGEELIGISKSGKVVKQTFDDEYYYALGSPDGTKFLFVSSEFELWSFDGSSYKKLAENVVPYSLLFSWDGSSIAYLNQDDELYLYNGSNKKIAEDVYGVYCISPDGKAVAYSAYNDDDLVSYYYNGNKSETVSKNRTVVAMSNDAAYLYLRDTNGAVYVQKGTDTNTRVKLGEIHDGVLNADGTQILYYDGTNTYVCEKAGEKVKITGESLELLANNMTAYCNTMSRAFYCSGVASFKKQVFETGSSAIAVLSDKWVLETRVKNVDDAAVTPDGKTLIYTKNDNLYTLNLSKSDASGVKLASKIEGYLVSYDGKTIFYEDEDHACHTVTLSGKIQDVTEDKISNVKAIGDSGFLYLLDDEVYYTTGGEGTKIKNLGDVENLVATRFYALVINEDGTGFLTTNGKNYTKIYED